MGLFSPSTSISNKDINSLQVTSLCHDFNSFEVRIEVSLVCLMCVG